MNGKDYILDNDMYFCLTTRPKWEYIKARDIYCMDYKSISRYMCIFRAHPDTDSDNMRTAFRNYPDSVTAHPDTLSIY